MSVPKGKHQSGQAQQTFQPPRYSGPGPFQPYVVRDNSANTSRGADVQFGSPQGFVNAAAVAAAHASQHGAHAGQPPSHGQGSVSGAPGSSMRAAMHHPGSGGPPSGPQQQQQQSSAPTSTPPGAPQQHGDMNKQAPPPSHMQGQQSQLPGAAHGQIHLNYISHANARAQQQYPVRQPLNSHTRMPSHRGLQSNSMTPQQLSYSQVPHQVYQSNIVTSNQPMFTPHQLIQYPGQGRGGNSAVQGYYQNQAFPMFTTQMMPTAQYSQPQNPQQFYYQGPTNPAVTMVRSNMMNQQQAQQQQQGGSHVGNQAVQQAQIASPGMQAIPVLLHEKTQRRRAHAIPIVNPETGKDLLDELCSEGSSNSTAATPPRSGDSSARQTPQPNMGTSSVENNIAAEFAAKVAIAAGEDNVNSNASNVAANSRTSAATTVNECGAPRTSVTPVTEQVNGPSLVSSVETDLSSPSISQHKQSVSHQPNDNLAELNSSKTNLVDGWKSKSSSSSPSPSQQSSQSTKVEAIEDSDKTNLEYASVAVAVTVNTTASSDSVTAQCADKAFKSPVSETDSSNKEIEVSTSKTGVSRGVRDDSSRQTSMTNPLSAKVTTTTEKAALLSSGVVPTPASATQLTTVSSVTSLPQRPKREQVHEVSQRLSSPVPTATSQDICEDVDEEGKSAQWRQAKGRNKQMQREMIKRRGAEKEATDADTVMDKSQTVTTEEEEDSSSVPLDSTSAPTTPLVVSTTPSPVPTTGSAAEETAFLDSDTTSSLPAISSQVNQEAPLISSKTNNKEQKEQCTEEEKMVAALNEENSRASADDLQPPSDSSPTSVIEKPLEPSTKLVYNKDQWSPLNLEGKKKYERDFLMQLKNDPQSMKRPEDLPKLEVVCDTYKNRSNEARPLNQSIRGGSNADSLLMPKFMSHNTPRGSLMKRNSQQGKPKAPKVIQLNLSLNEDVKLNEIENAWRPTRMGTKAEELDASHEDLYKKVRSVLNKLTPQKFDLLVEQVKALPIDTKEKLEGVIKLVFEKAVDEPSFSVAYAMMCQTLSSMHVPVAKNKDGKEKPDGTVNFKKLLLIRCQTEFEKQRDTKDESRKDERLKDELDNPDDKKKDIDVQLQEEDRRIRMKYVGVNRFIGELYKRNMLTAGIMVQCISKLLEASDEESLECLCKLLTTIGKELETRLDKDKKAVDLTQHFQRMQAIVDSRKTSSRIRFMLQDVIELRADRWRPRRGDSNPKTMDEIAKEAERESLTQLATPQTHTMRGGKEERDRDRDRDRKRGRGGVSDDGWTTAGGGGRISTPRGPLEINKLKVKHSDMDSVNLGSKSQFTSWSKGSGGHKSKPEIVGATPAANPFNVLSSVDTDKPGMLGTSTSASSRSSGREAALAEARKITGGDAPIMPRLSRPSSRDSSRDSSVMREEREETSVGKSQPTVRGKGPELLPGLEFEARSKLLIEEYLSAENQQDLLICVQEEIHPIQMNAMLSRWMLLGFEWSATKRSKIANAMVALSKEGVIDDVQLMFALEEVLAMADDLLIDIPMTYTYLAAMIVPLLLCEALQFSHLKTVLTPMKANEGAQKLMLECMKLLQIEGGPGWIVPHWLSSDVSWSDFVPADKVEKFLTDNGLSYLLEGSKEVETLGSSLSQLQQQVMGVQEMHDRLITLMPDCTYDHIVQWIAVNIGKEIQTPKYIRALMTVICEVGTYQEKNQWKLNTELFDRHSKLIQRYVDSTEVLELQALYAIQAFVTRLMHPPSLLKNILNNLLEESILSKDSIQAWVKSEDPAEVEGRGVALKSINQFITWLDEPEYDSPDEIS